MTPLISDRSGFVFSIRSDPPEARGAGPDGDGRLPGEGQG